MVRKALSYSERERRRKEQLAFNESCLAGFTSHLEQKGLSEKTVNNHLDNISLFLNVYLLNEGVPAVPNGCFLADDYLGRYLIERPAYINPKMISDHATSLKKFYKYMLVSGSIEKEDYSALLEDIRIGWPAWRDSCRDRNDERYLATRQRTKSNHTGCSACGCPEIRSYADGFSLCLECYNERESNRLGARHFTDQGLHFFLPDDKCMPIEFEVEHMLFAHETRWIAREVVDEDDARQRDSYEGLEVQLYASSYDDPVASRQALIDKTKRRMEIKSLDISKNVAKPGEIWGDCVQRGRDVITAADRGIAHIEKDGYGNIDFIIDGYRFSSREFLHLIAHAEGFDLHWKFKNAADDLPEPSPKHDLD